jgi:hypothetical protein
MVGSAWARVGSEYRFTWPLTIQAGSAVEARRRREWPRSLLLPANSVNDLAVRQFVERFEMRNFQAAHSLDGQGQRLIGTGCRVRLSQSLSRRPEHAENLGPIESLTLTVVAETHMVVAS